MKSLNVARFLSQETLAKILQFGTECEVLDFKQRLKLSSRYGKLELARDALAMTNTRGGFIIVGVEDKTRHLIGVDDEDRRFLQDGAVVNSELEKLLQSHLTLHVAMHMVATPEGVSPTVAIAVIYVPPREGNMLPAPIDGNYVKDGDKKDSFVFSQGDILIRKADSSTKARSAEDHIRCSFDTSSDYEVLLAPSFSIDEFVNPYNISVVAREETFKGREEEMRQIVTATSQGNHVTIYGLQRIGKTSLIQRAFGSHARRNVPQLRSTVYGKVDLQEVGSKNITQKQFIESILIAIAEALSEKPADDAFLLDEYYKYLEQRPPRKGDTTGLFRSFRHVLETMLRHSSKNVILFLDEFSEVCRSIERNKELVRKPSYRIETIHPNEMYIDIPFMKQFSSLLKSETLHRRLTFIFAVRPFVAEYDNDNEMQVIKLTSTATLFYLSEDAAKSLICDPIRGILHIDQVAADYLYRQTAGHPYLIQFMMQKLVDKARLANQHEISVDDVKMVEKELVTQGAPYLTHFNVLDSDYSVEEVTDLAMRRFGKGTLALVSKIGSDRPEGWVEKEEIVRQLGTWNIHREAATRILAKLQEAKILSASDNYQDSGKHYLRVAVPLLRKRYLAQDMYEQYFQDVPRR